MEMSNNKFPKKTVDFKQHKINLWTLLLQDSIEAISLVTFRKGLEMYLNKNSNFSYT